MNMQRCIDVAVAVAMGQSLIICHEMIAAKK